MKNKFFTLTICILFFLQYSFSQNAIKQKKQQTNFFYTQLNLHGGYVNDINGSRWDITNQSPKNQFAFQFFSRNKKFLQKGYVKRIQLSESKFRFSVPFDKTVNEVGYKEADVRLQLLDTWLKFNTKWDRTNLWIGNKSIPYGHNPSIDPVSSFMTNIIKRDIGFVQDVGFFIKTPISNKLDVELSITSGGMLNKPVIVCDNLINNEIQNAKPRLTFSNYSYDNTWLVTSHVGSPTFQKNEFGLNLISGRINNTFLANDFVQINRIGFDYIYKYRELFKWTNQIIVGYANSDTEGEFGSVRFLTNLEVFLAKRFFISSSFAYNYDKSIELSSLYHSNLMNTQSLTYSFSPHTRIRLNYYFSNIIEVYEKRSGILLQFVTGIGKRP